MRYVFIQTRGFRKESEHLELTLEDIRGIENAIIEGPRRWPTIAGTSGLRKMRFAPERQSGGKSGGVRVCYFILDDAQHVYLVTVFAKNEKQDLNADDRKAIAALITRIKAAYRK